MVALGERSIPNGQELLAEFIQYGRQKPFEEIVRRYAGMVFNVCYRITKDKHEAEDATQAVFLTLALQAKRGVEIKALGPWLQQVAKRLALDTRRSKKRRAAREERHHTEQTLRRESLLDDALPSADLDELKTVLHEELQKLPAKYRLPLILHYFGGLSREEMAAELNCKPSTLGVRIFRGREMLAGRLTSRGINISGTSLAIAMGLLVRHAVSQQLISSTSYAATALMAGHDGAGFASAHVIGLTRRATSALTIGKVKFAAITMLLASTSLGAGAKALGVLPQIDVQRLIVDQISRIIHPFVHPLEIPLRVDATSNTRKSAVDSSVVANAQPIDISGLLTQPHAISKPGGKSESAAPAQSDWLASGGAAARPLATDSADKSPHWEDSAFVYRYSSIEHSASSAASPTSTGQANPAAEVADAVSGGGGGGSGSAGDLSDLKLPDPLPSKSSVSSAGRNSDITITQNDLFVGSATKNGSTGLISSSSANNPSASPAAMIAIPAIGGTVTASSTGVVSGWGTVNRTGTIEMNGKVVANGQGVDRTLNLSTFTSVQSSITSPGSGLGAASVPTAMSLAGIGGGSGGSGGASAFTAAVYASQGSPTFPQTVTAGTLLSSGWYAINHGRLTLPLLPSATSPNTLTWGDDPNAPALTLVNSVRVTLPAATATGSPPAAPTDLSLLSTDRADVPNLSQISGSTLALWEVDPNCSDLTDAQLSICYDPILIDELGANLSSLNIWTCGDTTDTWQAVNPATFSLDSADDLLSGSASDIRYFAVSVDAGSGMNVENVIASHLAQVSGESSTPSNTEASGGASGVPEPTALSLLALAAPALLGRRRRRIIP